MRTNPFDLLIKWLLILLFLPPLLCVVLKMIATYLSIMLPTLILIAVTVAIVAAVAAGASRGTLGGRQRSARKRIDAFGSPFPPSSGGGKGGDGKDV